MPIVNDCAWREIAITDSNISSLVITSRQLAYSNLAIVRSVWLNLDSKENTEETLTAFALYEEIAKYLRPVYLSVSYHYPWRTLGALDFTRLRHIATPYEHLDEVIEGASTTLQALEVIGDFDEEDYFPDETLPMSALSFLKLEHCKFPSASIIPDSFLHFLSSCTSLEDLHLLTRHPSVNEAILSRCGSNLKNLNLYTINFDDTWTSTKPSLASYTPQLQSLYLGAINCLYLLPYPPTLRRLEFDDVDLDMTKLILAVLRQDDTLPGISHLGVALGVENAEWIEAQDTLKALAHECEKRRISWETYRSWETESDTW